MSCTTNQVHDWLVVQEWLGQDVSCCISSWDSLLVPISDMANLPI